MMSRINIQYNCKAILESVFKCGICKSPLIMFGCSNKNCENYNIHIKKGSDSP
jgi:hypothetical protein